MDVAVGRLAEVGGVGLLAEPVPVAGEDAPRPRPLEGEAEPANAAEEVNEAERRALLGVRRVRPSGARRSDAVDRRYTGGKDRNSLVFRRLLRIPGLGAGISRLREAVSNLLPAISGLRVAISDQSEAVSGV
jgi:hypothetical protein